MSGAFVHLLLLSIICAVVIIETLNAIERVIDAVMKADDMSRKFENMWKTTLVMHNVWNPSIQSHPISLSHHASFKWETLPTDVSTYLEKTGRSLCDLDVHCFCE